jgi:hypothetical protein
MFMQNVTHAAVVAGAMALAATAGVMFVKMTSSGLGPQFQTAAAAIEPMPITQPVQFFRPAQPLQPAPARISVRFVPQYFRNCLGALMEAQATGVLPGFAALDAASPGRGRPGEKTCSAATPSVHYEIAYFSDCAGGGDFCPVLARVTRAGRYIDFQRD